MHELKYEKDEQYLCLTSCPFLEPRTKISSTVCRCCEYFHSINSNKQIVYCNHPNSYIKSDSDLITEKEKLKNKYAELKKINILLNTESTIDEVIDFLNNLKDVIVEEKQETKVDPYLVKGVICEVWHNKYENRKLRYFHEYSTTGSPLFTKQVESISKDSRGDSWSHYKVIGTIWNYAPDWAEWYAVDKNKEANFYRDKPILLSNIWDIESKKEDNDIINYEESFNDKRVNDWRESLVKRPKWTNVENKEN